MDFILKNSKSNNEHYLEKNSMHYNREFSTICVVNREFNYQISAPIQLLNLNVTP